MNPELIRRENYAEREIDQRIELLKEAHPFITNEEYWSSQKEAMSVHQKLKKEFSSIVTADISLSEASDQEELDRRHNARLRLAEMIKNSKEEYRDFMERLAEAIDEDSYIFMPQDRPMFEEEANPFFGAEELGVPELLPNVLMLSASSWKSAFAETYRFDEIKNEFCSSNGGFGFFKETFAKGNILADIGLSVADFTMKKSDVLNVARHETVHGADFLKSKRRGTDRIIEELIAYRIDGKMSRKKDNKSGNNLNKLFMDEYFHGYIQRMLPQSSEFPAEKVSEFSDNLKTMLEAAEVALGFNAVTELLLNSESISEFSAAVIREHNKNLEAAKS